MCALMICSFSPANVRSPSDISRISGISQVGSMFSAWNHTNIQPFISLLTQVFSLANCGTEISRKLKLKIFVQILTEFWFFTWNCLQLWNTIFLFNSVFFVVLGPALSHLTKILLINGLIALNVNFCVRVLLKSIDWTGMKT